MATFVNRILPRAEDDAYILLPSGSYQGHSRVPQLVHHLMRVTLIAIIQSGTRILCSLPLDCTLRSLGTSTGP